MLVREVIAVYCEEYTKHINIMGDQNKELLKISRHV
jgi:hypothetical protein